MVLADGRALPQPERTDPEFDINAYLAERKTLVESALEGAIATGEPAKIYEAMRYSLLAGGKRLRPILCLATCELTGGTLDMAIPTACALEMIHTMSLIHDDLPAMDDDNYRRGKLTNHKVYGEDIAILAGDGLLAYAFEYAAERTADVPADRLVRVLSVLSKAVGALVAGQVLDLESEGNPNTTADTLEFIHRHKTGALLEACVTSGALLTGASADDLQRLSRYAQNIGLAFQIIDDVLDITATQEELGKTAGKDLTAQKVTYPSLWGLEESQTKARQLVDEAIAQLAPYGSGAAPLAGIAERIVTRRN